MPITTPDPTKSHCGLLYSLEPGASFFDRVRAGFGFSASKSRRSGCLALRAAFAASTLDERPLAEADSAGEAGAGAFRFAIDCSFETTQLSAATGLVALRRLIRCNLTWSAKHLVHLSGVLLLGMHHLSGILLKHY